MNGRLYDPVIGRMLSPDNFVQLPAYSQGYNRYTYALNNPLRFNDPSGEETENIGEEPSSEYDNSSLYDEDELAAAMKFPSRKAARQWRRTQGDLNPLNSRIRKTKTGRYEVRDNNSQMGISQDADGNIDMYATASAYGFYQRTPGFWEGRKEGGEVGRTLYAMSNGVNVFARQPFYGRGYQIPTLDGFSVTKGSNEAIDAGIDGLLTVAPLPLPKGGYSSARLIDTSVQSGFLTMRRINGGILINNSLRVQVHRHPLSPIKGRGYPGSISATHLNVNSFHLIFNPSKWDALSTWRHTPFRF